MADDSSKTAKRNNIGHTFENADSSSKVVDSPSSLEGSGDDSGRGDEIVGEGVVEVALKNDLSKSYDIWSHGGLGVPGARKRPGQRQTPSRICNFHNSVSHWTGQVGDGMHGRSSIGSPAAFLRAVKVCRFPVMPPTYWLFFLSSSHPSNSASRSIPLAVHAYEVKSSIYGHPHLAVNSSKVSSACSARREAETLKGRAAATAERAAKGAGRTAAARTMEEPRAATRSRAADCMVEGEARRWRGEKRKGGLWGESLVVVL